MGQMKRTYHDEITTAETLALASRDVTVDVRRHDDEVAVHLSIGDASTLAVFVNETQLFADDPHGHGDLAPGEACRHLDGDHTVTTDLPMCPYGISADDIVATERAVADVVEAQDRVQSVADIVARWAAGHLDPSSAMTAINRVVTS